jgi:transposase-like protein
MKESERPAREIALELGVRRNQLYKWAEQLEDKGEAAFKGKGRPKKIESCFVLPHILKPTAQSVIASLK